MSASRDCQDWARRVWCSGTDYWSATRSCDRHGRASEEARPLEIPIPRVTHYRSLTSTDALTTAATLAGPSSTAATCSTAAAARRHLNYLSNHVAYLNLDFLRPGGRYAHIVCNSFGLRLALVTRNHVGPRPLLRNANGVVHFLRLLLDHIPCDVASSLFLTSLGDVDHSSSLFCKWQLKIRAPGGRKV